LVRLGIADWCVHETKRHVLLLSGRKSEHRQVTEDWLEGPFVAYWALWMKLGAVGKTADWPTPRV
jgi:hypothetical protein